MMHNLHNSPEC